MIAAATAAEIRAQDPPPAEAQSSEEPAEPRRIVEGRPALYSFKRGAHPLTWVELAGKPVWALTRKDWVYRLGSSDQGKDKKVSGFHMGIQSAGTGSGYGFFVTPYHKNLTGRGIYVEAPLLYTYMGYQLYQFNGSVPIAGSSPIRQLSIDFGTGYSDRPQDDFYGIGNETSLSNQTEFKMVTRAVSGGLVVRKNHWTSKVYGVYRSVGITQPSSGTSAQAVFNPAAVPGLNGGKLGSIVFTMRRITESRDNYTFKGGIDEIDVGFNRSIDGDDFQYWRTHLYTQHFLPLSRDSRKVIAVRGTFETNQPVSGGQIPFFDMPILGSSETVRGFDNFRFRDNNVLALTLEYRYRIWRILDWGFFVDEGQVAPRLRDFSFDGFHTGYGARLFMWPKPNLPLSVDYGRSNEGWRLYFNLNTRF
jgi:hypothetical protein